MPPANVSRAIMSSNVLAEGPPERRSREGHLPAAPAGGPSRAAGYASWTCLALRCWRTPIMTATDASMPTNDHGITKTPDQDEYSEESAPRQTGDQYRQ